MSRFTYLQYWKLYLWCQTISIKWILSNIFQNILFFIRCMESSELHPGYWEMYHILFDIFHTKNIRIWNEQNMKTLTFYYYISNKCSWTWSFTMLGLHSYNILTNIVTLTYLSLFYIQMSMLVMNTEAYSTVKCNKNSWRLDKS